MTRGALCELAALQGIRHPRPQSALRPWRVPPRDPDQGMVCASRSAIGRLSEVAQKRSRLQRWLSAPHGAVRVYPICLRRSALAPDRPTPGRGPPCLAYAQLLRDAGYAMGRTVGDCVFRGNARGTPDALILRRCGRWRPCVPSPAVTESACRISIQKPPLPIMAWRFNSSPALWQNSGRNSEVARKKATKQSAAMIAKLSFEPPYKII